MVFIDAQERSIDYADGLLWCKMQGYIIKGIVSDGMSGILKVVGSIPLQICQVHIQRNIRKKLTNKPKNIAAQELLQISNKLCKTNSLDFYKMLNDWHDLYKDFLKEYSLNESGKKVFAHRNLRSAYRTIKKIFSTSLYL